MRALLVSVFAGILGVFAAWGATRMEFAVPEEPVPVEAVEAAAIPVEKAPVGGAPKFELVGSDSWDFGVIELGRKGEHVFAFRNVGTAPLAIEAGRPTCRCTVSEMAEGPLYPGEDRTVKLKWEPTNADENFRQRAPFRTNDPEHSLVELKIVGKVREAIKVEPNPLNLGQFSPAEPGTHEIRLWVNRETPLKLGEVTYSDKDLEPFFHLDTRDMTPDELEQSAGSYYGQVLTLTIKQGIPLGNVQQRLTLAHDFADRDPIELRVNGKAVGAVTVLGRDFDVQREDVEMGNVPSKQGKKTSLSLVVKGPQRDQVKFKLKSVDPAGSLQAELGEPTTLSSKSISWPLTIEIPQGAEPVNRLGSTLGRLARIELDSGTTEVPNFVLQVRMAVTGDE